MAIEEKKTIHDIWSEKAEKGVNPILTPVFPQNYQGKQVIINADRLIFNAKQQTTGYESMEAAGDFEGGDIHMFSQNFVSFSTNGSIHLNTGFEMKGKTDHEQEKNYIALSSPNIFLGLNNKKTYPTEPAVLGNKNQEYQEKLLNFLKKILDKLSSEYRHIGDRGGFTSPLGDTFVDMRLDYNGESGEQYPNTDPTSGDSLGDSIGGLKVLLREIKSQHVFIKD
jgi:hypothetical protein